MSELKPEDAALLARARGGAEPTEDDRARVGAAILASLGVGAGLSVGTTNEPAEAAATATRSGANTVSTSSSIALGKILGVIAVAGAIAGAWSAQRAGRHPQATAYESLAAPTMRPVPRPAPGARPALPSITTAPASISPSARRTAPPASTSRVEGSTPTAVNRPPAAATRTTIDAEARLVRSALSARRSGNAALALRLLDEYARTYPSGVFAEESAAERIFALCDLRRFDEARTERVEFVRAHPDSLLTDRVKTSCASLANP